MEPKEFFVFVSQIREEKFASFLLTSLLAKLYAILTAGSYSFCQEKLITTLDSNKCPNFVNNR